MDQIWRDGQAGWLFGWFAEFPSTTASAKTFILEIAAEIVGDMSLSYIKSFVVIHSGCE